MATEIQGINRSAACETCGECEGGVVRAAITDICCVADIVIDQATRCITSIVLTADGAGGWADYIQDSDDTSFLSQIGEKINFRTKRYNVTAFLKFSCINKEIENEVCRLDEICTPIAALEKSTGEVKLIGVDIVKNENGDWTWKRSKTELTILNSLQTGTGAEECRYEMNLEAVHRKPAATLTGIGIEDLLAA